MFPVETLRGIQEMAQRAQQAQTIDVGDPRRHYFQCNGQLQSTDIPPAVRSHQVGSLADLVRYAQRANESGNGSPVIWHGELRVVLVIDDEDRRDLVAFELTASRELLTLIELEGSGRRPMDHFSFIRLLRIKLGLPADLVTRFRKLNWSTGERVLSDRRHAKESLDQSMLAEVSGVDGLPDELEVRVPVYREEGERAVFLVRCAVEIDPTEKTLELMPLPGEIEGAYQNAQRDIRQRLEKELGSKLPIYYGAP